MLSLTARIAVAHSLGTPLSTIKIISQNCLNNLKIENIRQDIELLSSQVERCNQILKRLSLNPNEEDDFIDEDLSMRDYLKEIVNSFKETSNKEFILNIDQDSNLGKLQNQLK